MKNLTSNQLIAFMMACIFAVFAFAGCAPSAPVTPAVVAFNCQGSYTGIVNPPSHERRIENRNRLLAERGIALTGDDATDNSKTGGGGEDGGVYLAGAFGFETDASCNIIKGEFVLHGTPLAASGTVHPDGTFNGNANGAFDGVVTGTSIKGNVYGGLYEEYHNGVIENGVFTVGGHI